MTLSPFPQVARGQPEFRGMLRSSQYLAMRDGTRLAMDLYLPKGGTTGRRLPTILVQSRYWRSMQPRRPLSWVIDDLDEITPGIRGMKPFFVRHGYALVYLDVRGSGASFGTLRYPWDSVSLQDAWDVLDWIIAQPWSNGRVAGFGVSYLGTTAELLLALRHPAVKAVVPMYNHPDVYADVAYPGGLFNQRFINDWSEMDAVLDSNRIPELVGPVGRWLARGVRPVDGEQASLELAIREHAGNGNAFQLGRILTYRDEPANEAGICVDDLALHRYRQAIEESQVPSYGWASWLDAGTADAALRRFLTYPGADLLTIGAWSHGGFKQASPYKSARAPISPPPSIQWGEILRFLDAHLLETPQAAPLERRVFYYTLGAETWQSSPGWPPAGWQIQRWYLALDQALSQAPPGSENGEDIYRVDFEASTGPFNRWWELSELRNQTVRYPNLAERRLFYLTPPFEHDLELCGHAVLHLELTCSTSDTAVLAYLEDVTPDGQCYYLTEGVLRALHRKVCPASPYNLGAPYHSCRQSDAWPLEPGQPAEIVLGLQPVSALIRAGHRLRLSLAGHDAETFLRVPETDTPDWRVQRNTLHASWIDLPFK